MDTIEKVYCTGHDNNDALVSALASKNNCDPMAMAAIQLAQISRSRAIIKTM